MPTPSTRPVLARLRVWVRWHRRSVAVGLVAVAVLLVVRDLRPPPPAGVLVVVASRDLAAGDQVAADGAALRRVLAAEVPDHALTAVPTGRVVALPVRRGEILTDVRLVASGLLDALSTDAASELVAAPVHLADAATVALLRGGDTVDVLGAGPRGATTVAARRATVLLVPATRASSSFGNGGGDDGVVVLAVSSDEALALARAAATDRLSVVVRPG